MKLVSETLGHSSERVTSDIDIHTGEAMTAVLWDTDGDPDDFGGQPGGQTERPGLASVL